MAVWGTIDWKLRRLADSLGTVIKRHLRSGFKAIAATAVVAGALLNLATPDRAAADSIFVTAGEVLR